MSGAGHRILVDTELRHEEATDEVTVVAASGHDDATPLPLSQLRHGREVQRQQLALSSHGKRTAQRRELQAIGVGSDVPEVDERGGERGVTTEPDLTGRREPTDAEAVSLLNLERTTVLTLDGPAARGWSGNGSAPECGQAPGDGHAAAANWDLRSKHFDATALKIGRRTDASPQLPAAKNPVPSATFSYATDKTGSTNTKGPAGLT